MITLTDKEMDIELEEIRFCPICGGNEIEVFGKFDYNFQAGGKVPLVYFECKSCTHLFMNPRPTDNTYSFLYESGGYRRLTSHTAQDYKGPSIFDFYTSSVQANRQMTEIVQMAHKKEIYITKVMDIGGALGMTLFSLQEKMGWAKLEAPRCVNVEPDVEWAKFGRPFGIVDVRNLEEAKEHGPFDFIICSHTLEHLNNPIAFLREMGELGAAEVSFFVEVPHPESVGRCFSFWHPQAFTQDSLALAAKNAGMEPMFHKYTAMDSRVYSHYMMLRRA
jgi:hypothetical protein